MTKDEFATAALALLGTSIGWHSVIARRMGIDPRTVRRWLSSNTIPDWVEGKLAELSTLKTREPWPRDEWIVGYGATTGGYRRKYIAHLATPRFVARVVNCDPGGRPLPEQQPADLVSGTVHQINASTYLAEVLWVDDVSPGQISQLCRAAADVIGALPGSP